VTGFEKCPLVVPWLLLAAVQAPDEGALTAWVPTVPGTAPPLADAMARVPRDARPGASVAAHVYAARGEAEGFAVVVRAPAAASITRLSVRPSALACGEGACAGKTIEASRIEAYRAMYQKVTRPTGPGRHDVQRYRPSRERGPAGRGTLDDPGMGSMCGAGRPYGPPPCFIPDGLVPYKRCSDGSAPPCPGDEGTENRCPVDGSACGRRPPSMIVSSTACGGPCNQELWVEVTVPRDPARAPPGEYRGALTVETDVGTARVPVVLHVWDFELPASPAFHTGFGSNTAPKPGGYGWVASEQDYLAKHRVSSLHYGRFDDGGAHPWELKRAWGVPNVTAAGFWPGVSLARCTRKSPFPTAAEIERWIASHGVPDDVKVYITDGDEIWKEQQAACHGSLYAEIRAGARVAHATRARVQSTVNPIAELAHSEEGGGGRPAVDIFVAGPAQLFRESPRNRLRGAGEPDVVSRVLAAGSELWTYNIWLGDSWGPKWQLDYAPVSYRLGFIAQALHLSGAWISEYWTLSEADDDPWVDSVESCPPPGSDDSCPMNGDSQFIYPGAPVGVGRTPVPHLRLKFFRDGIDDYDLVQILKGLQGGAAYAGGRCPGFDVSCQALVERLGGTDYSDYSTDTSALQRARKAIGERIAADPDRPRGASRSAKAGRPSPSPSPFQGEGMPRRP
jgi:hypothetical protein